MATDRLRATALLALTQLCLLLVVAVPSARALPCPSLGIDSHADGYVLTSDAAYRATLVAPDCSVSTISVNREQAARPGQPVIIPIIGPAPPSKFALTIRDYVVARVHRLPSGTQRLTFLTCPTFYGGADFTNARSLETITVNNCPSIETLDNIQFPESVKAISFRGANIQTIKDVVWPLRLQSLGLDSNKLTSIESNYPDYLTSLSVTGNPFTTLENIMLPPSLGMLSLPAVTSVRGIAWPYSAISFFFPDDTTITEFELRRADFTNLINAKARFLNGQFATTCSDPTATVELFTHDDVVGVVPLCVVSDERFEAVYRTPATPETMAPMPATIEPSRNSTTVSPAPTGSGSGSGSVGDDLLDSVLLPSGRRSTGNRTSDDEAQSDDSASDATDDNDSPTSKDDSQDGADVSTGGARSSKKKSSGSPDDLSDEDGDGAEDSVASSTTSLLTLVAGIAGVGAVVVLAMFAVGGYRRSLQQKNKPDDDAATESSWFAAFPATPQGDSASLSDERGAAPIVGFLANDVRNDASLAAFRIDASAIAMGKTIARGGFGVVLRGIYHGRDVAIKQMQPGTWRNDEAVVRFMDEIRLCAHLKHEKIVQFVGISWTSLRDLSVVSEFMQGGDLHDTLRNQPQAPSPNDWHHDWTRTTPKNKTAIAHDIAEAVVYLHSLATPILHRDLKARNVLLDDRGDAKLSDFGISREVVVDETMTSEIGTAAWIAPEVLRGERYSEKADIYSFGVLLVEMDRCRHPYGHSESGVANADADADAEGSVSPSAVASHNAFKNANIILLVSTGKLRPEVSSECPVAIKTLAEECLRFDPTERPTASEVARRLGDIAAASV